MKKNGNGHSPRITDTLGRLQVLQEEILSMGPETRLQDVLGEIAKDANDLLGSYFSVVQPYDESVDKFNTAQFTPGGPEEAKSFEWREPRQNGASRVTLQNGLIAIEDYEKEESKYPFLKGGNRFRGAFKEIEEIQATIGIRLEVKDEAVGVLFVNYPTPQQFSQETLSIAKLYAGQAAIAIKNARLYEKLHSHAENLDNLLQRLPNIQEELLSMGPDTHIKDVLEIIAKDATELLESYFSVVLPYDQSTDKFILEQFTPGGPDKIKFYEWQTPRPGGSARTALKDKLLIVPDYEAKKDEHGFLKRGGGEFKGAFRDIAEIKATIGIRLDAENETVGILFANYLAPQEFSDERIDIAKLFASQAAVAIKNARLYEELSAHTDNLDNLLNIAGDLSSAMTTPETILATTLQRAVDMLDVTRGGIVYHEEAGGIVVASYVVGQEDEQTVGVRFPDSKLQRAVRRGEGPIPIEDVATSDLLDEPERKVLLNIGIKSSLIIPLVARGRVLGSLGLDETRIKRTFSSREIDLAQILANIVATAIDNARLYEVAEKELTGVLDVVEGVLRRALQPGLQLDDFLQYVMDQTLELMEFNAGWLLLKEGDWVRIRATDQQHRDDVGRVFLIDGCISGLSMLKGEPISIPDMAKMPDKYRRVYQAPRGVQEMQSELVAPLMAGDEAIGAFNIESRRPGAFEAKHVEMIRLLSEHVALAVELARLREETAALSEIGLDLARATNLETVVGSILDNAFRLVHAEYGQVMLKEDDKLVVRFTTNPDRGELPPDDLGKSYEIDDCITGLAVQEKMPVIVHDIEKPDYFVAEFGERQSGKTDELISRSTGEPRYKRALEVDKARMHAEFAVPIFSNGDVFGVLNVETERLDGFTLQQRRSVLEFVESNKNSLVNALVPPQRERLEEILRGALVRAETAFGQILRVEGNDLIIEQTTGGERVRSRVPISSSITGRAARNGTPDYVPDISKDPNYQRYLGEEIKSELVIPLTLGEEIIGVLNVESPVPGFFTLDHARTLEAFAGQAAVAVDRARQFEELTLAEMGGLAGDIVHQLNNPIGAMGMRLNLLKCKDFYPELASSNAYFERFIKRTERDLNAMKEIVQELRKELKEQAPGPFALQPAIESALEKANLPDDIKVVTSAPNDLIHINANDRLVNVLWNLFDNAQKAMPKGGDLTVSVEMSTDAQLVIVKVKDTGRGIEIWRKDLIFDPDESTTDDPAAPGHGLGLWWTKAQVEHFGGSTDVESEVGVGTTIILSLRKA